MHPRFVTRQELEKLALGHLVGTPLLRAYMHGFFVDNRLYRKAKVQTLNTNTMYT
jgi:ribosome biogenesis protein ENP2